MNPRQNALLELKIAGIRAARLRRPSSRCSATAGCARAGEMYRDALRPVLSPCARALLGQAHRLLPRARPRQSFYFRGTSGIAGLAGQLLHRPRRRGSRRRSTTCSTPRPSRSSAHLRRRRACASVLDTACSAGSLSRQRTLSLLGVPWPQREQIERTYPGGIAKFIRDRVEAVFTELPLARQLFLARLPATGRYTPRLLSGISQAGELRAAQGRPGRPRRDPHDDRCPTSCSAPRRADLALRAARSHGLAELVHHPQVLAEEWNAICRQGRPATPASSSAAAGCRSIIVDPLEVTIAGRHAKLGELLRYDHDAGRRAARARPRPHLRQLLHRGRGARLQLTEGWPGCPLSRSENPLPHGAVAHSRRQPRGAAGELLLRPGRRATTTSASTCSRAARNLYEALPIPEGGVWLDMGGGTGSTSNTSATASAGWGRSTSSICAVLCCRQWPAAHTASPGCWTNVETVEADVTTFTPPRPPWTSSLLVLADDDPRLVRGHRPGDAAAETRRHHRRRRFLRGPQVSRRRASSGRCG